MTTRASEARVQEIEEQLRKIAKDEITENARIICAARDPFKMIELLRHRITCPAINGGAVPEIYLKIAQLAHRHIHRRTRRPRYH